MVKTKLYNFEITVWSTLVFIFQQNFNKLKYKNVKGEKQRKTFAAKAFSYQLKINYQMNKTKEAFLRQLNNYWIKCFHFVADMILRIDYWARKSCTFSACRSGARLVNNSEKRTLGKRWKLSCNKTHDKQISLPKSSSFRLKYPWRKIWRLKHISGNYPNTQCKNTLKEKL